MDAERSDKRKKKVTKSDKRNFCHFGWKVLSLLLISELQNVSVNTLNFSRIRQNGISTQNIRYLH